MKTKSHCKQWEIITRVIHHVLIVLLFALFVLSCQEEKNLFLEEPAQAELKSGTITIEEIDALILKIEDYVTSGMLDPGIANSLISKLQNAKKSIDKGNGNAVTNQVQSVIKQLTALVGSGTIDEGTGEELLEDATDIPEENDEFTDPRDNRVYKTVNIGTQCWMAENLAYLPSVTSISVTSVSTPYYYVWGYWGTNVTEASQTASYLTYGALYNWPAAMEACPEGWRLPTDADWNQLAQYIDDNKGPFENDGWEWKNIGGYLKSTSGWSWEGNGTDDFGFKALPGGYILNGSIQDNGSMGLWWTSTVYESNYSWNRRLYSTVNALISNYSQNNYALSVRCIKDN